MEATETLLRLAIANENLSSVKVDQRGASKAKYFDVYRVELPLPAFSGIPTDWTFAIQNCHAAHNGITEKEIFADADRLLRTLPRTERIVLVSDDHATHLADEFDKRPSVYCLDALSFTANKHANTVPRLAPFLLAVRRKMSSDAVFTLLISPYQREKPVDGWRFFGRQKQLDQLVHTNENYVIVGARRVGKTSLIKEAYRRIIDNGENAHLIDVQNCSTAAEVIREILGKLSARDLARTYKHKELLGEEVLSSVLKRMSHAEGRTTIFLDELGNVITNLPKDNWAFLGVLRKYSQNGNLRFVVSCFQEYFLKQQQEFTGPLINFAHTMRLRVFTRKEVEELVLAPLRFWKEYPEREEKALVDFVMHRIGPHPFLLQFFCFDLFQTLAEGDGLNHAATTAHASELALKASNLFNSHLVECFEPGVDELFLRLPSALLKYLYLKRCYDAESANDHRLDQVDFTHPWLEDTLQEIGFEGTFQSLSAVLEALEMHGLCTGISDTDKRMRNAAPVIYSYMKKTVPSISAVINKLSEDARRDCEMYGLTRSS